MKDLFVGASGRLNNHGGSRMFTTPHTINVPPEYTVETDVPSVAEFVTCSLDGRLWVYRRSRRFYVAAFRWDENTQRLVFVGTTILSNESFVMRGADWILTDKSLIQSLDDEPYISRTTYNDSSFLDAINKSYSFFPEIETWQKIQGEQIIRVDNPPSENLQELTQSLVTPLEFHYYSENNIKAFSEFSPKLCYINGQLYGKGKAHIGRAYLLPRTFNEDGETEDFYLYISPDYLRTYNGSFDDNDGWENLRVAPFTPESVAIFTPQNDDYDICKKAENAQIITLPNGESLDLNADNGALFFDALTGSNLALNDGGVSLLRDGLNYECKGIRQWITPSGKIDTVSPQMVMSSFDNGTLATHIQGGFHRELLAGKTLPLSTRDYSGKRLSLGTIETNNRKSIQVNSLNEMLNSINSVQATYEDVISIHYLSSKQIEFSATLPVDTSYQKSINKDLPIFYSSAPTFEVSRKRYKEIEVVDDYGKKHHVDGNEYLDGPFIMKSDEIGDLMSSDSTSLYRVIHSYHASCFYINPDTGEAVDFQVDLVLPNVVNFNKVTLRLSEAYGDSTAGAYTVGHYEALRFDSSNYVLYRPSSVCVFNGKICVRCYPWTNKNVDELGLGDNIYIDEYEDLYFPVMNIPDCLLPIINCEYSPAMECTEIVDANTHESPEEHSYFSQDGLIYAYHIFTEKGKSYNFQAVLHERISKISLFFQKLPTIQYTFDEKDLSIFADEGEYSIFQVSQNTYYWTYAISSTESLHIFCINYDIRVDGYNTHTLIDTTGQSYSQPERISTKCVNNSRFFVFRSELHPEIFDFQAEIERSKLF